MKAIVTVIGKDRVGITAAVCALLATLYLYRRRAVSLQNTVKSQGAV